MIDKIQHRGWVKIETASDFATAQLLKGMLEDQQIPTLTLAGRGNFDFASRRPLDNFGILMMFLLHLKTRKELVN